MVNQMDPNYEVTRIIPKAYNPSMGSELERTDTNTDTSKRNPDRE